MLAVYFHGVNLSTILHVSHRCEDEPPEPLPEDGKWRWFQPPVVVGKWKVIDRYLWWLFPENVILSNHYCTSMDCDGLILICHRRVHRVKSMCSAGYCAAMESLLGHRTQGSCGGCGELCCCTTARGGGNMEEQTLNVWCTWRIITAGKYLATM